MVEVIIIVNSLKKLIDKNKTLVFNTPLYNYQGDRLIDLVIKQTLFVILDSYAHDLNLNGEVIPIDDNLKSNKDYLEQFRQQPYF